MRKMLPLLAVAILLVGFAGVFAVTQADREAKTPAVTKASSPTVGEFLVRYARTMRLAGESSTPEQALMALQAAGVLGSARWDLHAALTEGAVVRISETMMLGLESENRDRAFSRRQTDTFFEVFNPVLENGQLGDPNNPFILLEAAGHDVGHPRNPKAADPRERGKGKKLGLSPHFPF